MAHIVSCTAVAATAATALQAATAGRQKPGAARARGLQGCDAQPLVPRAQQPPGAVDVPPGRTHDVAAGVVAAEKAGQQDGQV